MNEKQRELLLCIVIALAANNLPRVHVLLHEAKTLEISHKALYEAILQIHLFAGYPASIEGLNALHSIFGPINQMAEEVNTTLFEKRGISLCKEIYTSVFDKMIQKMTLISPDLAQWMIRDGYGKTLSREGLDIQNRELINLVILALGFWKHQFISHLRGSLNVGLTMEDIFQALETLRLEEFVEALDFAHEQIKEFQAS
jgi:4-carboxymuconolactone decarboxylase